MRARRSRSVSGLLSTRNGDVRSAVGVIAESVSLRRGDRPKNRCCTLLLPVSAGPGPLEWGRRSDRGVRPAQPQLCSGPVHADAGTLPRLTGQATRVLLGDSAASQLPSNILDTIVEVCLFARDVSIAHEDTDALWGQLEAAEQSFSEISEQLQRFRRVGESELLAAAMEASRPEMKEHGHQAVAALGGQVDGWLAQYKKARDAQVAEFRSRIDALHKQMLASLDRFALPLRGQPTQRLVRRNLEGGKDGGYLDTAKLELLPGLRAEIQLEDTENEQPRKIKSLLGKGSTLQVGTKKTLLRRTEEPAHVSLDDLLISAAQVSPDAMRLELAKKAAGPVTLRLGLGLSEGRVVGRGELGDGAGNQLPDEDQEVMQRLWDAMQAEAARVVASPARSLSYALRDEAVESPAGYVNVAERILEHYRPMIRTIMEHSPNSEELTIKVEVGDRREEKWITRQALAAHLSRVPETFVSRLRVPEVFEPPEKVKAPATEGTVKESPDKPATPPELEASAGEIEVDPLEEKATRAYAAIPAELLVPDDTQDISLTDLEVAEEPNEESSSDGDLPTRDLGSVKVTRADKPSSSPSMIVNGKSEAPKTRRAPPGPTSQPPEKAEAKTQGKAKLPGAPKPPALPSPKKPPPPAGLRRPKR